METFQLEVDIRTERVCWGPSQAHVVGEKTSQRREQHGTAALLPLPTPLIFASASWMAFCYNNQKKDKN